MLCNRAILNPVVATLEVVLLWGVALVLDGVNSGISVVRAFLS